MNYSSSNEPRRCKRCWLVLPHVCLPSSAFEMVELIGFVRERAPACGHSNGAHVAAEFAAEASDEFIEAERVDSEMDANVRMHRCKDCGGTVAPTHTNHMPDCPMDRSVTPDVRWRLRNPDVFQAMTVRLTRIKRIKRRWAVVTRRCPMCLVSPSPEGFVYCDGCREVARERRRRWIENKRPGEERAA